jgi:hypothetical protein
MYDSISAAETRFKRGAFLSNMKLKLFSISKCFVVLTINSLAFQTFLTNGKAEAKLAFGSPRSSAFLRMDLLEEVAFSNADAYFLKG